MLKTAQHAIFARNCEHRILRANPQTEIMFGYSTQELLGQALEVLVPERFRVADLEMQPGFVAEPKIGSMGPGLDLYGSRKDGLEDSLEIVLNPMTTAEGSFAIATIIDTTDRRGADEATRNLAAVVESCDDAIITKDLNGIIRSWNLGAEKIFGYTSAEMVGQHMALLLPPERTDEEDQILKRLRRGERVDHFETVRVRKDGQRIDVSVTISPTRSAAGRIVGASKVARDITERNRLRQQAEAELRKSHDLLLQLLNLIGISVLIVKADFTIEFANDSFLSLSDTVREQVLDKPLEEVLDAKEPNRQAILAMKAMPRSERTPLTVELNSKGSRPCWVELDLREYPGDPDRQIFFLQDNSEVHRLRETQIPQRSNYDMIGNSPAMQILFEQIDRVARGDWTVLLEGETGVGEELVARAIHAASARSNGAFIAVNCAGLTDTLLSSQLFGHVKGAFTGASMNQQGLFQAAQGGTLFLDEIGDVSAATQASLLRVLQEKEIVRLGETRVQAIDVRIIAATNRNLRQRVDSGQFRDDLFYRIRNVCVCVPPLRERQQDIPLLAKTFLARQQLVKFGKLVTDISPKALDRMIAYPWPGNVRELRAAIEHAVVYGRSRSIEVADLPPEIQEGALPPQSIKSGYDEHTRIVEALHATGGNRMQAAKRLGMGRATLYRRLKELGIHNVE